MNKITATNLLIAISQIEGYIIGVTGLQRPNVVYKNLDIIVNELIKIIKDSK